MAADFRLEDVIDIPLFQELQDRLNRVYAFPSAIIDNEGHVLTATNWQDVCTKFHRQHPECLKECVKSDRYILEHLREAKPAVTYRCPHGLVDNATPIIIGGRHVANYFTGQFFLEPPDLEFFRKQARKYGFDEEAYLAAVRRVPVWSKEKLKEYLDFIKGFVEIIGALGHRNLALKEGEGCYREIFESAGDYIFLLELMPDSQPIIRDLNENALRKHGFRREELIGQPITVLDVGADAGQLEDRLRHVRERGWARFEVQHKTRSGEVFSAEALVKPIVLGGKTHHVSIERDITERKRVEKALRESHERLSFAQSASGSGYWDWDIKTGILSWAPEFKKLFGLPPEASADFATWEKTLHPDDLAPAKERIERALAGRTALHNEYRIVRPDGGVVWIEAKGNTIYDENGAPVRMSGLCVDVTARKQAEQALRESEKMYRSLFESLLNGFAYCRMLYEQGRPSDFVYLAVNEAFTRQTGLKDVVGKKVSEVIPGIREADPQLFELYGRVASTGQPEKAEILVKALGHWFAVSVYSPAPEHFVAVFDIVSERRKAEAALRESHEQLDLALRSSRMGVWRWDIDRDRRVFDVQTCRLLGFDPAGFGGKEEEFFRAVHPDDRDTVRAAHKRTLEDDAPYEVEYRVVWPDKSTHHLSARGKILQDERGRKTSLIGVLWDVTEQRRMAESVQSLQKIESLGTLAGGIAHDFNNMLTGIMGNLSMLKSELDGRGEALELVAEAEAACQNARGLARQLLTFASGGAPVKEPLDVGPLLKEAAVFAARGTSIQCEFRLGEKALAVMADKDQLAQVVQNLVINAVQAMPFGGTLTLEAETVEIGSDAVLGLPAGPYIRVAVRDRGVGIPDEALGRVFDPFYSTKAKGRGLGLSVCRSVLARHGGAIGVESSQGKGAVFTFFLPAAAGKAPLRPAPKARKAKRAGRILVMDDDPAVLKVLERMLTRIGWKVVTASQGEAAVEAYRKALADGRPFKAVILDMTIVGGMGGEEAARLILELDADARLIVASGYANNPVMARHRASGFCGMLPKPFRTEDVEAALEDVLESAR